MASRLITTIKSWIIDENETFRILGWDGRGDCQPFIFKDARRPMLLNTDIEKNVYCGFDPDGDNTYVNAHSVKMLPINNLLDMDHCRQECQKYVTANGLTELTRPTFRLMVNLKFRGFQNGGNKALFSDRLNSNITMDYLIPARMETNECVVFEWEILENTVRNYFFNATKREFVNFKRPSWRSGGSVRPAG